MLVNLELPKTELINPFLRIETHKNGVTLTQMIRFCNNTGFKQNARISIPVEVIDNLIIYLQQAKSELT